MMTLKRSLLALAFGLGLLTPAGAADVTVFAAASLKTALDQIAKDWQDKTGNTVSISYDSSAKLAKQIEQGASADLFISASEQWMDSLAKDGLIKPETRKTLLGNSLILVAADPEAAKVDLAKGFDLAALVGEGKLAMGLVDSVPAGQYGKEALVALGMWDAVEPKVVQSENVRAALKLVETGEAAFGIVYASDAVAEDKVAVIGTFPEDSHKPITYPAALVAASTEPEALEFLNSLSLAPAQDIFAAEGFALIK